MNCGAVTAFLPNFGGFPSPRGPHSSTVQLRRAPGRAEGSAPAHRRARDGDVFGSAAWCAAPPTRQERSPCPAHRTPGRGSAASAAPPAAPARRPASAGRAAPARRVPAARVPPWCPPGLNRCRRTTRLPRPRRPTSCRSCPRTGPPSGGPAPNPTKPSDSPTFWLRTAARNDTTNRMKTTARMKPMNTTLPPPFPQPPPVGAALLRARGMPSRLTSQAESEELQRVLS